VDWGFWVVFLLAALHISNSSKNQAGQENSNNTAGQKKGKILSSFPEAAAAAVCKIYFYCYCGHTRYTHYTQDQATPLDPSVVVLPLTSSRY